MSFSRRSSCSTLLLLTGLVLLFVLLLSNAMFQRLDHDEHQFVASAALLARDGLLPYRDYSYFHMPYLVAIFAVLFCLTDHLLLASRLFCMMCGYATVIMVGYLAFRRLAGHGVKQRGLLTTLVIIILVGNPLFMFTSGRSWNHDPPTLLAILAFAAMCRGLRVSSPILWLASAGAMMGIAVGMRLTFAPAAAVMPLALASCSWESRGDRVRWATAYGLGAMVSLIPCAILFVCAPRAFIFGNFEYPLYNTTFRDVVGYANSMTSLGKIKYYFVDVLIRAGNLAPTVLCLVSIAAALKWRRWEPRRRFELRLLVLLFIAFFVAAFAPTPLFLPYFYTPMVFTILIAIYAISGVAERSLLDTKWIYAFAVVAVIELPALALGYADVIHVASFNDWVPVQVHDTGRQVAIRARQGRVLTLSPIFPLEGGAEIYPELATGPFAWRVGPLLPEELEQQVKSLDPDDLDLLLRDRPPTIVLLRTEGDLETPILKYGQRARIPIVQINKMNEITSFVSPRSTDPLAGEAMTQ